MGIRKIPNPGRVKATDKARKGGVKTSVWMTIIDEQFYECCKLAGAEFINKSPSCEEYESRVLNHMNEAIRSLAGRLIEMGSKHQAEEYEETTKIVLDDFKKGYRKDLEKMIKESFNTCARPTG